VNNLPKVVTKSSEKLRFRVNVSKLVSRVVRLKD